jgi:hypothetical protein
MTAAPYTRKLLVAILLLVPIAASFSEVSDLIDFTRIMPDAQLDGVAVNEATLLEAKDGYRSYLPNEWNAVPYDTIDPGRSSISVQRMTVERDAMTYSDESCMRIAASIDDRSPGFYVFPPFPPDVDSSWREITESGDVAVIENEGYGWASRFEGYGLIQHAGHVHGAAMIVRNLGDPVRITVMIENEHGERGGIALDIRSSGNGFITVEWEDALRDLWVGEEDHLYAYLRIVGFHVESLALLDLLQERKYLYATITAEEEWIVRRQHEAERVASTILLDIASVRLIYGSHHVDPWEPLESVRVRDDEE